MDLSKTVLTYNNYHSVELEFDIDIDDSTKENKKDLIVKTKRQLSLDSQNRTSQGKSKLIKLDELTEESMEIDNCKNQIKKPPKK